MEGETLRYFADANLAQAVREALGGPLSLPGIAQLTALTADACDIYNLAGLAAAIKLTYLSLADNEIENLAELKGLVGLETLHLHNNRCCDLRPLARLKRLRCLTLGGFWVDEDVGTLTLEAFGPLWGPAIFDLGPLSGLCELRELHVSHHRLKKITVLRDLRQLVKLTLDGYQGGGPIQDWSVLRELNRLRELCLCSNHLTSDDLAVIAELPQLEQLDLRGNHIEEIEALLLGRGLISGARLDFRANPLSRRARQVHVPQLRARGVLVQLSDPG